MRGTKKIDWLNHFLEFVVVVIGILLAFQLNTCRENKKEQILVDKHLENIIAETKFNQSNIESAMGQSDRLLSLLDSITERLTGREDLDAINALALQLLSLDYNYTKKNAYNSLTESGDIRFIKDFEKQNDIVSLYEYYLWMQSAEEATRQTYMSYYFPYALNNLDLVQGKPKSNEIYSNQKFQNYLSTYRYSLVYRKTKQEDTFKLVSEFLTKYDTK